MQTAGTITSLPGPDLGETYRILQGDAMNVLDGLASDSVQCCVTSPPYFGLRDYGTALWQGGNDDCDHRGRSLTSPASTLSQWNNSRGQQYKENAGGMPFRGACEKCGAIRIDEQLGLERSIPEYIAKMVEIFEKVRRVLSPDGTCWVNIGDSYAHDNKWGGVLGLKTKELMGIPWRLAFALQDAGWWLRQDIIWSKPNPMPESVTDRCTKSHEYLFLLTKSSKYFYDAEAIKEPASGTAHARKAVAGWASGPGDHSVIGHTSNAKPKPKGKKFGAVGSGIKNNPSFNDSVSDLVTSRNKRSVWTIQTQPMPDAHFATYPEKLVEPCILAGSRPGDLVLDPFSGTGTTGLVALRHKRSYVGIELNPESIEISHRRLGNIQRALF